MTTQQPSSFEAELIGGVGTDSVVLDPPRVAEACENTLAVDRGAKGIVFATNVEQVIHIVTLANRYRQPLYPISCGQNVGYGDRAPVADGQYILDLSRMNRIRELDVECGDVVIEPGVTQMDLHTYLKDRNVPFWKEITDPNNIISPGRYGLNLVEESMPSPADDDSP